MKKLKSGINKYVSNKEYHEDREYLSSSALKMVLKDPKDFEKVYVNGETINIGNQEALDFGSYMHTLVLEPLLVDEEYVIFNGYLREGEEWDALNKEKGDRKIITITQDEQAHILLDKLEGKEKEGIKVKSFFQQGEAEQTMCASIDGVKVKARFDYIKKGIISDLKTTSSEIKNKKDAEKICKQYQYDVSVALYLDIAKKVTGEDYSFYFIFMSKKDNDVHIFKASDNMVQRGREKYKKALRIIKKGRENGVYEDTIIEEIDSLD